MTNTTAERRVYPGYDLRNDALDDGCRSIRFTYTNWRGITAVRTIRPISVWFGSTEWHPEPQWLMHGIDLGRDELRDFAMRDMKDVRNVT